MAKIKLTKTELKSQQDALKQYSRFLPTLQLKKQQLQMEIRSSVALLEANTQEMKKFLDKLKSFVAIFSGSDFFASLDNMVKLERLELGTSNIAGVNVPIFKAAVFAKVEYDYFVRPLIFDEALKALQSYASLREAHKVLEEQHRLLSEELRTTTQRVNLFEKVKIPECKNNIRTIRIQIGDMDTAAVARSKIAKKKTMEASA